MKEDSMRDRQAKIQDALPPADERRQKQPVNEICGREGPEPTRYGDWEKKGRCIDF